MLAVLLMLLLLLPGCANQPPAVVKIPVRQACDVATPVKPVDCHAGNKIESRAAWLQCELSLGRERVGYILELEAALSVCKAGN